jgi:4-amino-4-deoxychorismate lyase
MPYGLYNNQFIDDSSPCLPLTDRGFLFGDGFFSTLRVDNGIIEHFQSHLSRLKKNCEDLQIEFPKIKNSIFFKLLSKNNALKGLWRLKIIISRKESSNPKRLCFSQANVIILLSPYKEEDSNLKLNVETSPLLTPLYNIKSLSYLHRLYLYENALNKGFNETLCINEKHQILEGVFSNIFWVHKKSIYYPNSNLPYLKGIYLSALLKVANSLNYQIKEVSWNFEEIPKNYNSFLCNTMTGVQPIQEIANQPFRIESSLSSLFKKKIYLYFKGNHLNTFDYQ